MRMQLLAAVSHPWLQGMIVAYDRFLAGYMSLLVLSGLFMVVVGWFTVNAYVRMRPMREYRFVGESAMSMPVSVIVPAYNEEATILDVVYSLLHTQFNRLEVVVINDGSLDRTLVLLKDEFELVAVERAPRSGIPTQPVYQVYASALDARLCVIDKRNGGKADALNVGVNHAQYPLVCAIDADTVLDPGALARLVWEFQSDPDTVATGGIVRIANGSTVRQGRVVSISTPQRQFLANVQILEYLRAFLGGRLGWSRFNSLMIISGAFGLFRRESIILAGGYLEGMIAEDVELVLRIRRYYADRGLPCRMTFFPDPICWTEAPATTRSLGRQRDRWQRGLGEALMIHRGMLFRRRYHRVGMIGLPYVWLFEFLEPIATSLGVLVAVLALIFGYGELTTLALILSLAWANGYFITMAVILIEERAFRRYPNWRDLRRMAVVALVENFGYRQWQAFVRLRAIFRLRSQRGVWGEMQRSGFSAAAKAAE